MAINLFEGARRVALLIAGVATVITVIVFVTYEPYVSLKYGVWSPYGSFVRTDQSCPPEGSTSYIVATTSKGKDVNVYVCFFPMEFEDGKWLIPYKIDEKQLIWGAPRYNDSVMEYVEKMEARFKLSSDDEKYIAEESSRLYREKLFEGLRGLVIGIAVFGGVVWAIGWIVRGFLGIPQGADRRD